MGVVLACLLAPGCAEFDGETYPQVVEPRDVERVRDLPSTHFVIGEVSDRASCTTTHGDLADALLSLLSCAPDRRLERRLRRTAAKSGGELLVGFGCSDTVQTATHSVQDPNGDTTTQTETTVTTECSAQVARAYARDLVWW